MMAMFCYICVRRHRCRHSRALLQDRLPQDKSGGAAAAGAEQGGGKVSAGRRHRRHHPVKGPHRPGGMRDGGQGDTGSLWK